MNYKALLARDLELGSGMIEGAVRTIIGARFDFGGSRWIRERAEALLQLRWIEANGDWDAFIEWVNADHQAHATSTGERPHCQFSGSPRDLGRSAPNSGARSQPTCSPVRSFQRAPGWSRSVASTASRLIFVGQAQSKSVIGLKRPTRLRVRRRSRLRWVRSRASCAARCSRSWVALQRFLAASATRS
ncbi:MAG TPA: hypothetical protein VGQ83_36420 [Polyangia bacterium]|jgi:hypothetical protein